MVLDLTQQYTICTIKDVQTCFELKCLGNYVHKTNIKYMSLFSISIFLERI